MTAAVLLHTTLENGCGANRLTSNVNVPIPTETGAAASLHQAKSKAVVMTVNALPSPMPLAGEDRSAETMKLRKKKNSTMRKALREAARRGLEAMQNLYENVEPTLKRKGFVLGPNDPATKLSLFSAPDDQFGTSARAAYAALFAAKRLKER